ncbi:flagellar protein FlaG [Paenibacillus sp. NPDC093718]|uniref:flagellar protein FlaG n=1 Tax=Paenibacillus sp. NPDC093718 TaxID=3390601 RepID=UPI003D0063EC
MRIDSFSDKPQRSNEVTMGQRNIEANVSKQGQSAKKTPTLGEDQLQSLIEHGNKVLQRMDTRLQWSIHEESQQLIVKVMDTQTNEILREIPPEKYLELVQNLCEQVGLFLDERK